MKNKDICEKLGVKKGKIVEQYNSSGLIGDASICINGEKGSFKELIASYLNI